MALGWESSPTTTVSALGTVWQWATPGAPGMSYSSVPPC